MNAMKKIIKKVIKQHCEPQVSAEPGAKQKILSVAARLFAEKGFSGVSTRDIARESGLNISLISYYFNGKEGLYQAVIGNFAHGAKTALEKILNCIHNSDHTKEQFHEHMRIMMKEMLHMKISNPNIIIILQREMIEGLPNAREIHETMFTQLAENLIHVFESAQKKGFIRKDLNPAVLFFSLYHAVTGYLIGIKLKTPMCERCLQLPEEIDSYVDNIMKIFIEGVGK